MHGFVELRFAVRIRFDSTLLIFIALPAIAKKQKANANKQ